MKKGIDISEHQLSANINYAKLGASVDFVILRSSYGNSSIDKQFLNHARNFKKVGTPILGVYHFLYTDSVPDAVEEAKNCIRCVEQAGLPKSTIIFADFEYDTVIQAKKRGITLGKKECTAHTKAFVDYCKKQGYPVGIYANIDYHNRMYDQALLDKHMFWLADYNGKADFSCEIRQYSSKGRLPGYSYNLDMNYTEADKFSPKNIGTYSVAKKAVLRSGASIRGGKIVTLPKNAVVKCTGFSSVSKAGNKWLYVSTTIAGKSYEGFVVAKKLVKG